MKPHAHGEQLLRLLPQLPGLPLDRQRGGVMPGHLDHHAASFFKQSKLSVPGLTHEIGPINAQGVVSAGR